MAENKMPAEKNKNEKISADDIKEKRALLEAQEALEQKDEEIKKLAAELAKAKTTSLTEQVPDAGTVAQLQAQVELLSRQVLSGVTGTKLRFREPTAADLVPEGEEVTFTARNVLYVVASYRDHRGLEKMPPHKLIVFQYAASDIRKEGREEQVRNFSQYTTNLKTEIAYLRDHPFYGITFSENTNEMLDEDVLETQFKIRAATQLSSAPPEQIFARAEQYKIPNFRNKSAEQLRILVVHEMAKEYRKDKKALDDEILKRRALGTMVMNQEKE